MGKTEGVTWMHKKHDTLIKLDSNRSANAITSAESNSMCRFRIYKME